MGIETNLEGGRSRRNQLFDDVTQGVLVAGRTVDSGEMTRKDIVALLEAAEALGKKHGLGLTVAASGDLSDTGPGDDEAAHSTIAIGLPFFSGGSDGPEQVSAEVVTAKLNAARAISADVWQALAALLPEDEREPFLEQEVGLDLLCVGPLAAAYFVFGEEGSEEDGGDGEYHHGQDMGQEPHDSGVWGLEVAGCEFEGSDFARVDFSEAAHQARLAAHPGGQYYLIARYD